MFQAANNYLENSKNNNYYIVNYTTQFLTGTTDSNISEVQVITSGTVIHKLGKER